MIPCFSCTAALGCLTSCVHVRKHYGGNLDSEGDRGNVGYDVVCNFADYQQYEVSKQRYTLTRFLITDGKSTMGCPLIIEHRLRQAGTADIQATARGIAGFAGFGR